MKTLFLIPLILVLNACTLVPNTEPAKAVDPDELRKAGQSICPVGTELKVDTQERDLYVDQLPQPYMIGISKGTSRCALERTYDRGGLSTWLTIQFPDNCLENGSLWIPETLGLTDSVKIWWRLRANNGDRNRVLTVHTEYRHSLNDIRETAGFVLYSCQ